MFGRDRELAQTIEAVRAAASGTPRVLLVAGDAGIGKTTLLAAGVDVGRDLGFAVLVGHCLDIDDGVALRPVREALRQAISGRLEESLGPVTRRMAIYLRGESDLADVDDLGLVLAELVSAGPVLLVLEDLHWADRSTIDFVTSAVRTARGPLCLVVTYRTDEITRSHPLRRALGELTRAPGVERIDLVALGEAVIAELVEGRHDGTPELAGRLFERSEGNPLYVEELLAVGAQGLPDSLSMLLLHRVDALSEPTRAVLRLASAYGSRVAPRIVASASGRDMEDVDSALREAIEANVLRHVGEHVDFRHGLIREAVYDDLMPGERARAHALLARALETTSGDGAGLSELSALAFHWYAAQDVPRAYDAAVRAGLAARKVGVAEAVALLDRALELYDQAHHDEGPELAELLAELALACLGNNERDRAFATLARALDALDETTDPRAASRVYATYVDTGHEVEGRITHEEALGLAVGAVDGSASAELARALTTRAEWHLRFEHLRAGEADARRALDIADTLGLVGMRAGALSILGLARWCLGDPEQAVRYLQESVADFRRAGHLGEAYRAEVGLAETLLHAVDPERATDCATRIREAARSEGFPRWSQWGAVMLAAAHVQAGRPREATQVLGELDHRLAVVSSRIGLEVRIGLAMLRGDVVSALPLARTHLDWVRAVVSLPNYYEVLLHVEVLLGNGLLDEARAWAAESLAAFEEIDGLTGQAIVGHAGWRVLDAARRAGEPLDADLLARAEAFLAHARAGLPGPIPTSADGLSLSASRALRAEVLGEPAAELWRAACEGASHAGAGRVLPVRLRFLSALLAEGRRDEVRTALPVLVAEARAMEAMGVVEDALKLARRHRIPLPGDDRPSKLDILTAREREVLDVLATGATNKAIAERLFISEKTVSVHVTNLLAKLGAANRTEAAALARELAPAD